MTLATRRRLISLIPLLVVTALVATYLVPRCQSISNTQATPPLPDAARLTATATAPGIPEQRIDYTGFTLSFNPHTHIPNWVAWELLGTETTGHAPRTNRFTTDPQAPGCALDTDYRGSGYDRGHMAPAGDFKWSPDAMAQTFYLTNICPQAHPLNIGAWKKLEEKCRLWAQADSAIIIVCGPVWQGQPPVEYIGSTQVAVPPAYFKAVLAPYANPPRAIAFIMPNSHVPGGMQRAACSVDHVEAITGHDLFAALPDSLERIIEAQANFNAWPR